MKPGDIVTIYKSGIPYLVEVIRFMGISDYWEGYELDERTAERKRDNRKIQFSESCVCKDAADLENRISESIDILRHELDRAETYFPRNYVENPDI